MKQIILKIVVTWLPRFGQNMDVLSGSTGVDTFDANVFLRFCVNSIRAENLSSAGTNSGASSSIKI